MTDIQREIVNALTFFGPLEIRELQAKLDLRRLVVSLNIIDDAAQGLVKSGLIKEATGYDNPAYKI